MVLDADLIHRVRGRGNSRKVVGQQARTASDVDEHRGRSAPGGFALGLGGA